MHTFMYTEKVNHSGLVAQTTEHHGHAQEMELVREQLVDN